MVRLVVSVMLSSVLIISLLSVQAEEIRTVTGGPVEQLQEAVAPAADHDLMQQIDRQLEQAMQEQGLMPVPPEALEQQDNQGEQADGGQGK